MQRTTRIWVAVGVAVLLLAAGGVAIAITVFGGDAPPPAALASPSASVTPSTGSDPADADGADGTWTVESTSGSLDDGTATFAGYRIEEELGNVGANTAVGRTQDVTGQMVIDGTTISELSIEVDMTTLVSDDHRRDDQLRDRGLETDAFPTATFSITEPIDLGSAPKRGERIDVDANGALTLHGVTQQVTVPIEAVWDGDAIEALASFDVALSDYGSTHPPGSSSCRSPTTERWSSTCASRRPRVPRSSAPCRTIGPRGATPRPRSRSIRPGARG